MLQSSQRQCASQFALRVHTGAEIPVSPGDTLAGEDHETIAANSLFKTAQELFEHARRNPGNLDFVSGANGSPTHLSAEVLKKEGKLYITHVPSRGAGDAMVGLLSNQVDLLITAAPTAMPQVQGGRARALAVTGDRPLRGQPNVPTFKDVGLPGYTVTNWFGLAAPKGTPRDVVDRLQAEAH